MKADTPRSVASDDLQRVALGPCRRLIEQGQTAFGEGHALGRPQVQQRRFRALNVVAQRGHRFAAALEVPGQLRRGDGHACGKLAFERRTDLAVELRARRGRSALVQHLAEQRVPEGVRPLRRIGAFPVARSAQP